MAPKINKRLARIEAALAKMTMEPSGSQPKPRRPGGARSQRQRPGPSRINNPPQNQGMIRIRRVEMVEAVKAATDGSASGTIKLQPSDFPFLKGLGKSFEKVKWTKIHVYWKPAGSLTTTGLLAIGVDWDADDDFKAPSRENILAYTPNISCPVREDCQRSPLKLPAVRLRQLGWLTPDGGGNPATRRPATLVYSLSSNISSNNLVGEIYIDYAVQMTGTRVSA